MLKRIEMGGFPAGLIDGGCLIGNPHHTSLQFAEVVDKISEAASKWIGNNTNWYKAEHG
jgi:hypothetical protein